MPVALRVVFNRLPAVLAAIDRGAEEAIERRALAVETDWKAGVRVDTGRLRRSITVTERRPGRRVVSTNVEYASYENYGTRAMSGSYAREKAVEKNRGGLAADVARAVHP